MQQGQVNYFLFLDDERVMEDVTWCLLPVGCQWVIVRSYAEFVRTVEERGMPEAVSFDHDLADMQPGDEPGAESRERTGSDCARWLAQRCVDAGTPVPQYSVHSKNIEGAANIRSIMESAGRMVGFA